MADHVRDEFKADLNIGPIDSYTIKQSTKVINNDGTTEKKETKSIEETKTSNPKLVS